MICRKCKKEIPDASIFCSQCGIKQEKEKNKKKGFNGSGSVYRIKGRRSNPWGAQVTINKKRIFVGTFPSETAAKLALAQAQANGISEKNNLTVEKIYAEWSDLHFRKLTKSGEQGYKTAWTYFEPMYKLKMRDLKAYHIQECIDRCAEKFSRAQCEKIKQLASQLCKKAMEYDIINKNYAQFVVLPTEANKGVKDVFTKAEIKLLQKNAADERARIILTLIYTGLRISELFAVEITNVNIKKGYLIGGSKTEAGKNRTVPISDKIMPYIKEWYNSAFAKEGNIITQEHKYLITNSAGNKKDTKNFREREFYPILLELGIIKLPKGETAFSKEKPPRLTPHSTRHTLATLASSSGVRPEALQAILGHADYSTTANIYEHISVDDLKKEMRKV